MAVLVAFLARFSVGNYNYTAATFRAAAAWFDRANPGPQIRMRFAYDAVLFGGQLASFLLMGLEADSVTWFRRGLICLLAADLLFLAFDRHAWPETLLLRMEARKQLRAQNGQHPQTITIKIHWPADYAPRSWVVNNFWAAIALIICDVMAQAGAIEPGTEIWVVLGVSIINSAIDLLVTRQYHDGPS